MWEEVKPSPSRFEPEEISMNREDYQAEVKKVKLKKRPILITNIFGGDMPGDCVEDTMA